MNMFKLNRMQLIAVALFSLLLLIALVAIPWVASQDGTIPDPGGVAVIAVSGSGGPIVSVVSLTDPDDPNMRQTSVLLGTIFAQTPSTDGSIVLEGVAAFPVSASDTVLTLDPALLSGWSSRLLKDILSGARSTNDSRLFELLCLTDDGRWSAREVILSEFSLTPIVNSDGAIVDYAVTTRFQVGQHGVCAIFVDRNSHPNIDVQRRADVNNPQRVTGRGGISGDPEDTLINYYDEADFRP